MTRRAQHRGNRPAALFDFKDPAAGEVEPEELHDNPLCRPCPSCGAPIAQPCTRGSRFHGRIRIKTYHDSRLHPTAPAPREPEPSPASPYVVCRVCGTAWLDEELADADYERRRQAAAVDDPALAELVERRDPDQIHTCPDCTHDL